MKYIKTNILLFLLFIPFIIFGQENGEECVEYEPIEMYNLRKTIIEKQNLDVWPSIVEIKNLTALNIKRKLRMTNSSDLSKFTEIDYNNSCRQDGTITTDLRFGKINLTEMKAEIYCRKNKYAELKLKN